MSSAPVDPAEVPVFTGDLGLLEAKVKELSSGGSKVETAGSDVHKSFGGLSAYYKAPEAEQLFGVTQPVADTAHDLGEDIQVIAKALGTYAHEITPLIQQLKQLKQDAADFRSNEAGEDDWSEDGDLVEENLNRRNKIAEVWAAFQEAERDCHAKIIALAGGKALHTIDASHKNGYGYDAEALKQSKSLPWGDAVEESVPWWQVWEHAWDFGKGFVVDGVWGTIKGLGTLVGVDGWDAAGQAWTGLAKLSTAAVMTTLPFVGPTYLTMPGDMLPSWLRESRTALVGTGKALVAWDQWGSNPSRAAGAVTFNVITSIFTGGAGGAASGAGKAGAAAKAISFASKAGKAGQLIDPMTYVFKGAGMGLSKVRDVMAGLKGMGKIEVPNLSDGAFSLPEASVAMPDGTVQLPKGAAIPDGAIKLPDGSIKLPEGTTTLPEGTVKGAGSDGRPVYMDPKGSLYNADGTLRQHHTEAPEDLADQPAGADPSRTEAPADQPALATVGARGDDAIRSGFDISEPARAGDDAGTHAIGGTADNMPTNSNTPRHGGSAPHSQGAGGVDNSTSGAGHAPESGGPGSSGHGSGRTPSIPHQGGSSAGVGGGHDLPGAGSVDGLGRAVDGAAPPPHDSLARPNFMRDGDNPYGPRGSLTQEQINEIQVYRANHEPGYREHFYRKDGTRKDLDLFDESGQTPPQLTRLSENSPWIRAKDAPEPPKPHFLDDDYVRVGSDTVTDPARRKILEEAAQERHLAIQWDNIVSDWRADAGKAHEVHGTPESAGQWGEARGAYKESHSAMGDAAEAFGEKAAEHHYIAEHHSDFEKQTLRGPRSGNDQFDQVWKGADGRMVVIEAKSSPGTELGSRTLPNGRKVSQGSREYYFDIIAAMTKRGEFNLVADLKKSLREGKLEYVVVKGDKNVGTYTGYQYRRFDISKGTLL
ncbi:hypothetical protein [Streptomyces sp. NPDC093589]|uniref:hypothetical protein n=1 Tax=Streptomyces sp. NPDC093589 TaxID=3366043 RepID=UPI0037F2C74D